MLSLACFLARIRNGSSTFYITVMLLNDLIVASSYSVDKTKESKKVSYTSTFLLETLTSPGLI